MKRIERGQTPTTVVAGGTEEGPAHRDALEIASRAIEDEREATAARDRYLREPIPSIPPDEAVTSYLLPEEHVHAIRPATVVSSPGADPSLGYGGTLYLTSHRLLLLGKVVLTVNLFDIREASIAGERLMLALSDGEGVTLDVDRPRLLRAEVAAVLRGLR